MTSSDWRWCFAINLPIATVALIVNFFLLRKELLGPQPIPELDETAETGRRSRFVSRLKTLDVGGQALFVIGFGLIVLGLTWGGATYSWASAAVITPLVLGTIITGGFFYWESSLAPGMPLARRLPWQKPMIPLEIIKNRDILLLFYTEVTSGMGTYAVCFRSTWG